jgi:hypothetical protein
VLFSKIAGLLFMRQYPMNSDTEFVKGIPALSLSQESELRQQVDRLRVKVADIDMLKEGYLELKEDHKRLQEQILQR